MSLAKRLMEKGSRRNLQRRADFGATVLRTLAGLIIAQGGRIEVRKEDLMLAGGLRVNAVVNDKGHTILTLQDENGTPIHVDQPVHAATHAAGTATADVTRQDEAVHGI